MGSPTSHHNSRFNFRDVARSGAVLLVTELDDHVLEPEVPSQDNKATQIGGLKRKRLVSLERSGAHNVFGVWVEIKYERPWESYKKAYQLKLDCFVTVASQKEPICKRVVVRSFSGPGSHEKLLMLHQPRHESFVSVLEYFSFEESFYVILERMAIILVQVVASLPYPSEQELAAILRQVNLVVENTVGQYANCNRSSTVFSTFLHKAWNMDLEVARMFPSAMKGE